MSQPHEDAGSEPGFLGQSKTLFVVEGNPVGMLYVRRGKHERARAVRFGSSLAAFEWCRRRGVGMVYQPADAVPDPSRN